MDTLTGWIALPLGFVMEWCNGFIQNYGISIIVFTLITKIIILPLSVWVQTNSIKMVKMQPDINRIKIKETKINKPRILDIGSGSGCIPITIYKMIETLKIDSVDISLKALEICTSGNFSNENQILDSFSSFSGEER